jgi:ribosomal peptide maturation radical SAM protein 1
MPFADIDRPSLGISLLQARLRESDIACDVVYLNLAFARLLGREPYQRIADGLPFKTLAGEWVFAENLYGSTPTPGDSYVEEILRATPDGVTDDVAYVLGARALAGRFLAEQLKTVPWSTYDVVGFSSLCAQNVASLALARLLKEEHPRVVIVFGGANWQGVMGRELHHRFPFVDFACSGEADVSLPELLRRLASPDVGSPSTVAGLVYRDHGRTVTGGEAAPVRDLDALPLPDFSDFFAEYSRSSSVTRALPVLLSETTRGCWWAADHPCLFCGLNGALRVFRKKTPARVLRELRELARRWPSRGLELVDNVVSPAFFSQVLPAFVERRLPTPLFLEVRPSLSHEQVRLLAAVRGSVQPGIESLSDHVLDLMGKGTSALENVRLLVWCKEHGVRAYWNIIHGFPGETRDDCERMLALVPALRFLDPPASFRALSLDRFSPYFERPEEYGFRRVRPLAAYRHIYPFPDAALRRIAFSFDYDYAPGAEPADVEALREEVQAWQNAPRLGRLRSRKNGDGSLLLVDTRAEAGSREVVLDGLEQLLYRACGDIRNRDELLALAREEYREDGRDDEEIGRRLASFVERRLMVTDGDRFLSLAMADGARSAPAPRRG